MEALSRTFLVHNKLGLHARPAASIAKLAQQAKSDIWLIKGDEKADAASIIDILTLACTQGTTIKVEITDHNDTSILENIASLFETSFGE
ncbi:HPr family phosphocarrier protein [Desulforegula conservatrix]|uniref:HPr family phosphocarrier protein n=1 Tax=Desulforegula conservatrix TaxID=153026 RepID=UPI0009FBBF7C|nr:HPr family phosphocarrier protein [Desulforegula conservatrix]